MSSNDFKGIPGGDPSRRPPLVEVTYRCGNCGKEAVRETRAPKSFTPPPFCSKLCKELQDFEPMARIFAKNRLGVELPEARLVGSGLFRSICNYEAMIVSAEKDPSTVQRYSTRCKQCLKHSNHYRDARHTNKKSTACTSACAGSEKAGLPKGVSCQNPLKRRFVNEAEAIFAVEQANAELVSEGEEQMVAYHCACGVWHFGHESKAVASQYMLDVRNRFVKILSDLLK